MDSEMVKGWHKEIAQKHNIMILGKESDFVRGPYRVIVSKKPINSLNDVKGLKVRMPPADNIIAVYKHLGANVLVLPCSENT